MRTVPYTSEEILHHVGTSELKLKDLAAELGISPGVIDRHVEALTGMTPGRYRIEHCGWFDRYMSPSRARALAAYYSRTKSATIRDAAWHWDTSPKMVRRVLEAYGVEDRTPALLTDHREELIIRYREGETCREIGESFGMSERAVRYQLKQAGEPRRRPGSGAWERRWTARGKPNLSWKNEVPADRQTEIAQEYASGATFAKLEKKHGFTYWALRDAIVAQGVSIRPRIQERPLTDAQVRELIARYVNGESYKNLATEFRIGDRRVRKLITAAGVEIRPRGPGSSIAS